MEAFKTDKYYTIDDIYALPEGERAELIDGRMYSMAAPSREHQRLSMLLSREISNYIKSNGGNCEVYAAPFAVFLKKDDRTYVEPDISVVCDPEKLNDKGCSGAPDWIIEIVSESSRYMDYMRKLLLYQASEVKEYWIVDPEKRMVIKYDFHHETSDQFSFGEKVPAGIYEDFGVVVE